MRVLIDTTYARRGRSGTGVYVTALVGALRAAGVEVVEAANAARRPPGGGGPASVRNLLEDLRWTQLELPRRARAAGADVLHHPLPAVARRAPCPQVVTVHDLAFVALPDRFESSFARWARRAHRSAARRADAVVCVSEATAADVRARWSVSPERIVVAPHGPGQPLPPAARRAPTHVLYVGDDEPRKNLALLRAACERFTALPLVVAGSAGEPVGPARLSELYAGALALVHPSLHEGFGLTLLEAMAVGTPVVAARSAAAAEVCADAALYVAPDDPQALAGVLDRLHDDPALRAERSARCRARAARFTWEASAKAHIEAYRRVLAAE